VAGINVVCSMDEFALFVNPITVFMNSGRVSLKRSHVGGQFVEVRVMRRQVERVTLQLLEFLGKLPVLARQLFVRSSELVQESARSLVHTHHVNGGGQGEKPLASGYRPPHWLISLLTGEKIGISAVASNGEFASVTS
jgi:hypothetical protein